MDRWLKLGLAVGAAAATAAVYGWFTSPAKKTGPSKPPPLDFITIPSGHISAPTSIAAEAIVVPAFPAVPATTSGQLTTVPASVAVELITIPAAAVAVEVSKVPASTVSEPSEVSVVEVSSAQVVVVAVEHNKVPAVATAVERSSVPVVAADGLYKDETATIRTRVRRRRKKPLKKKENISLVDPEEGTSVDLEEIFVNPGVRSVDSGLGISSVDPTSRLVKGRRRAPKKNDEVSFVESRDDSIVTPETGVIEPGEQDITVPIVRRRRRRGASKKKEEVSFVLHEESLIDPGVNNIIAPDISLVEPDEDFVAPKDNLIDTEVEITSETTLVEPDEGLVVLEESLTNPEVDINPEISLVEPDEDFVVPEESLIDPGVDNIVAPEISLVEPAEGFVYTEASLIEIAPEISLVEPDEESFYVPKRSSSGRSTSVDSGVSSPVDPDSSLVDTKEIFVISREWRRRAPKKKIEEVSFVNPGNSLIYQEDGNNSSNAFTNETSLVKPNKEVFYDQKVRRRRRRAPRWNKSFSDKPFESNDHEKADPEVVMLPESAPEEVVAEGLSDKDDSMPYTLTFPIEGRFHGKVNGRGHSRINNLSQKFNVSMGFDYSGNLVVVGTKGKFFDALNAMKRIKDLVKKWKEQD